MNLERGIHGMLLEANGGGDALPSLIPDGAVLPKANVAPAETGAAPMTQADIDAINKTAQEQGEAAASAQARGMLIEALG